MKTLDDFFTEVEYEKAYTYEQRIDLFNQFGIPTSQKYFTPFFTYLNIHINPMRLASYGYSHAGAVSSPSLKRERFQTPNLESKTQSQLFGGSNTFIYVIRNINSQQITVVKGEVSVWSFRFNVADMGFEFKLNRMELEHRQDKNPPQISCNPTKALAFLRLAGFTHILLNAQYK